MRITGEEGCTLMYRGEKASWRAKWLCEWRLTVVDQITFDLKAYVRWPVFIMIYVPALLIQLCLCLWDGGLREMELPERWIDGRYITPGDSCFEAAKEIYYGV